MNRPYGRPINYFKGVVSFKPHFLASSGNGHCSTAVWLPSLRQMVWCVGAGIAVTVKEKETGLDTRHRTGQPSSRGRALNTSSAVLRNHRFLSARQHNMSVIYHMHPKLVHSNVRADMVRQQDKCSMHQTERAVFWHAETALCACEAAGEKLSIACRVKVQQMHNDGWQVCHQLCHVSSACKRSDLSAHECTKLTWMPFQRHAIHDLLAQ